MRFASFGLLVYRIPIAFVFSNLLELDSAGALVRAVVPTALSAYCFAGVVVGYLAGPLRVWQRIVLAVGMGSLFEPGLYLEIAGGVLLLVLLRSQHLRLLKRVAGSQRTVFGQR